MGADTDKAAASTETEASAAAAASTGSEASAAAAASTEPEPGHKVRDTVRVGFGNVSDVASIFCERIEK